MTDNTRDERGRFLTVPVGAAPPITSDNAHEMIRKRTEKYRLAALRRIVSEASSIDPTVSTSADAFGLVAAKQFTALMDSDKPVIDQLDKLRRIMTGDNGGDSQREHEGAQPGLISMSAQTLLEIAAAIESHKSAARDEARAVDATIQNVE